MKKSIILGVACLLMFGCTSNSNIKEDEKMNEKEQKEEIVIGNVCHFTYHSEFCGMDRGVNVLMPEDYDENKQYKVIYYLHGIFGNEYSMTSDPEVKRLVAVYQAKGLDVLVVFPDMFARKDTKMQPGFDDAAVACYDDFIHDLTGDLMPFIKNHFSILEGRENTAICGFSMGGRESLFIGLTRPDLFGYVGAFAPAPGLVSGKDYNMEHKGQLLESELTFEGKEKPFYLEICCGTADNVVGLFPKSYHNIFENNGVEHIWFEISGAGHDGSLYNPGFDKFLKELL